MTTRRTEPNPERSRRSRRSAREGAAALPHAEPEAAAWMAVLASIGFDVREVDCGEPSYLPDVVRRLLGGEPAAETPAGDPEADPVPAFLALAHPDDLDSARALLNALRTLRLPGAAGFRFRLYDEGGAYLWRDVRVAPAAGAGGAGRLVVAMRIYPEGLRPENGEARAAGDDASRQRELGAELRLRGALFEAAFRRSPAAAMLVARDGRVLDVNAAFERLAGQGAAAFVGHRDERLDLWASRADVQRLQRAERDEEAFGDVRLRLRTPSGALRSVRVTGARIPDGRREVRLRLLRDVTEEERARDELEQAIRDVLSDGRGFAAAVADRLQKRRTGSSYAEKIQGLSERERAVLRHLADGASTADAAEALGLSRHTVRNYVSAIYGKLGVHSRAAAIIWARESGLAET